MEIHETYFQAWHRLSITLMMFKSGFVLMLTPTFLRKLKAGAAWEPCHPQVHIQRHFRII